ncbi:hypothetical protein QWJ23_32045, partial [Streptomyces sp. ZSW22]|nr:hypothetical protein [Streptomyces sp. ZSW22]
AAGDRNARSLGRRRNSLPARRGHAGARRGLRGRPAFLKRPFSEPEVVELLRTDREFKTRVSFEAADILNYLIRLARYCEFDLIETADKKLAVNIDRFPVDEVHGLKGTRYKTGR